MSTLKKGFNNLVKRVSTYEINEKNIKKAIREFELLLISNDVSLSVAKEISSKLTKKMLGKRAKRFSDLSKMLIEYSKPILLDILTPVEVLDPLTIVEKHKNSSKELTKKKPVVFLFLGINGTGKTTTIAKFAYLLKKKGYRVVLAASDTFRSGAQEQLKIHADKIGVKIVSGKYGSDSASVAYDAIAHATAKYADTVIIDTSGRMAINKDLMEEMRKIIRVSQPDYIFLVIDALAGNDATEQAKVFHENLPLNGVILTKMDADARAGALISVTYVTKGLPIVYLGTGQKYKDLEKFVPEKYVNSLLKI
ncbi:MAG: signal recognition particle-docking protein FtsY [Candidatus Hodarchaeales archaeon]